MVMILFVKKMTVYQISFKDLYEFNLTIALINLLCDMETCMKGIKCTSINFRFGRTKK